MPQLHQLIKQTIAEIQHIYLRDSIPWIIGCSWGKDSSCVLQLIWQAIAQLEVERRHKQISVITTDTGVENPLVSYFCQNSIRQFNQAAPPQRMPLKANLLTPLISNSFWVLTIGKGYSKPTYRNRWCTPRLKIDPSNLYIREQISRYGESILVLGVRKDESIKRKTSIESHAKNSVEANLSPSNSLTNSTIYTPIADWITSEVWQYLLQVDNPWGGDNQELFNLYRGATDSSECPLVVEENTGSCGKSRFGCYVCTVAQSEHSLTNTIRNDEKMEWLQPLLDLREELAQSQNKDRGFRQLKQGIGFHENQVNSQFNLEPTRGLYTQKFRIHLLRKLLQAQLDINRDAPPKYQGITLLSSEELSEIRYQWLFYHHEIEDLLPQIYEEVTKKTYFEPHPERVTGIIPDHWQTLVDICPDINQARLLGSLLNLSQKYETQDKSIKKFKELEQCLIRSRTTAESIYYDYRLRMSNSSCPPTSIAAYLKLTARPLPTDKTIKFQLAMLITEATMRIFQNHLADFSEAAEWSDYQQISELAQEIADDLQKYHQIFHSIRWNRARKKIKAQVEDTLLTLARSTYEKINFLGELLNHHAQEKIEDIKSFNQLIQKLQEAKMLVEINHLNHQISPVKQVSLAVSNPGCIPGLEHY